MIYTLETLEKKLNEVELLLMGITQDNNKDGHALSFAIGELTSLHSSSVSLMTSAEYHYKINSKSKNEELKAKSCAFKLMSERLNNSIGKAIESYRSMLSFEKLDYFRNCWENQLSAYKALIYLNKIN